MDTLAKQFKDLVSKTGVTKLKVKLGKDKLVLRAFKGEVKVLFLKSQDGKVEMAKYMDETHSRIDRFSKDGLLEKMKEKVRGGQTVSQIKYGLPRSGRHLGKPPEEASKYKNKVWQILDSDDNEYDVDEPSKLRSVSVVLGPAPGTTEGLADTLVAFFNGLDKGKWVFLAYADGSIKIKSDKEKYVSGTEASKDTTEEPDDLDDESDQE